ncbi:MAG: Uncharacterized protein LiPW15_791 [Parcubacteria group bacterium LiPW_15]|nr:MAG: Uncharacterized protein LiPW15_791 [Parcubacteria group bacterium LiPW_15]
MNSPNIQKFIVAFLILAAVTSSSVFFLLDNRALDGTLGAEDNNAVTATLDGQKVFVEKIPTVPGYVSPLASLSDIKYGSGANFTDYVTDKLAAGVLEANPKGPVMKNGVPNVDLPKDLASLTDVTGLLPGSFAPTIDNRKVSLLKDYTTEDLLNYLENSKSALSDDLALGLSGLTKASLSADSMPSITAIYDQTEGKIYGAKVPVPLKNFNSALLGFVNSQRVFFDQDDPVKALIAIQNPELAIGKYQKALVNEVKNLEKNLPQILAAAKDNQPDKAYAVLHAVLGVEKAYALLPDIIGGISNILNYISKVISDVWGYAMKVLASNEWLRKLLTEVVKNQLVKKMISQIINWVNGGGEPQFVNNWQGFLGDAVNTAAGGVITKYAPQLCSNFGPLVKVSLLPAPNVDYGATNNPYSCTLDRVVANIDQFKNDFQSGGWLAYGELLKPQNNIFGSMVLLSDAMVTAGDKAKEAAQADAGSGSGYKSQTECVDQVTYNQPEQIGSISSEADARATFGSDYIDSDCPGGGQPCTRVIACNSSNPDAKANTTPGDVVAKAGAEVSSSPVDRIVNANDLTGLVVAIANSALSKLMTSAKKGMTSLTTAELNKQSDPNANCAGLTGEDLAACQKLNQDIATTGASAGNGKDGVVNQLKKLFQIKQKILDEGSRAVAKAQEALGYLNIASSTCSGPLALSVDPDAQNTLSFIEQSIDDLGRRVDDINDIIKDIAGDPAATSGTDAFDGKLKRLNAVIELAQADKVDDLAALFNIPLMEDAGDTQKKDDFYNKFANDIDNAGSTFGKIFGSLDTAGNDLGDIKTFATTISVDGGCGILEKAKLLYQPVGDAAACSLKAAEKTCRSGNY